MNQGTDAANNKPVIPSTKTPVSDNSHLTDDEKGQVKDNVQESNPAGKVTNVDDHGNTTITYPDGSKNVVSGKDTTTGTSKDNLNKSIDSGNNTKSSGNYNNTSDQNRDDLDKAIKHGQDVVNDPHASQKDIDNATKAINKAIDNVNNGQTDASKNKPVIPSTKTPEKPDQPSKEGSKTPEKPIDSRTVDNHVSAKSTAKRELPQTGATINTGIWTGLVSMIASLGLLGASKKRKKN